MDERTISIFVIPIAQFALSVMIAVGAQADGRGGLSVLGSSAHLGLLELLTEHEFPALDARSPAELERRAARLAPSACRLVWVPRTLYELTYLDKYCHDRIQHAWDSAPDVDDDRDDDRDDREEMGSQDGERWDLPPFYVQHQTGGGRGDIVTEDDLVRLARAWIYRPAVSRVHRRLNNAVLVRLIAASASASALVGAEGVGLLGRMEGRDATEEAPVKTDSDSGGSGGSGTSDGGGGRAGSGCGGGDGDDGGDGDGVCGRRFGGGRRVEGGQGGHRVCGGHRGQ